MNNINQLKKQHSGDHPGFGSYLECMSRALFLGLSSFTITFTVVYIPQTLLKKKFPFGHGTGILISTVAASCVSYYITAQRTKLCQAAWMANEEKHTFISALTFEKNNK